MHDSVTEPSAPTGDGAFTRAPADVASSIVDAVTTVVRGKADAVRLCVAALMGGGHVLIDDLPGTGKTLLGKALASSIGGRFGRVQCTADLLPSDITGTSVFRPDSASWEFRPGPLFSNVLLLDELNRATPRTQAALLEPMEERQATVDGQSRGLPRPFFCIATENPCGQAGTFRLPESQLDRFSLVLSLGLPDRHAEREILTGSGGTARLPMVRPVTTTAELSSAIALVEHLHVAPALVEYVLDLAGSARAHPALDVGPSPRAALGLVRVAQGLATVHGRDYVLPDDVQAVFVPGLAHRVLIGGVADPAAAWPVLGEVLHSVPVPR